MLISKMMKNGELTDSDLAVYDWLPRDENIAGFMLPARKDTVRHASRRALMINHTKIRKDYVNAKLQKEQKRKDLRGKKLASINTDFDLSDKLEILLLDELLKNADKNEKGRTLGKRNRNNRRKVLSVELSDITLPLLQRIQSKLTLKPLKAFVKIRDPTHSSLKLNKPDLLAALFELRSKSRLSKDKLLSSTSRTGGDDDDDDSPPQSSTLLAGISAIEENEKRIIEAYQLLELENEGIVFERFKQNCLSLQTCLQDHVNRRVLDQKHNGMDNNVWEWTRVRSI